MSITDQILELQKSGGRACMTCTFLDKLDPIEKEQIEEAINDERVNLSTVYRYLTLNHEVSFTLSAFRGHISTHMS